MAIHIWSEPVETFEEIAVLAGVPKAVAERKYTFNSGHRIRVPVEEPLRIQMQPSERGRFTDQLLTYSGWGLIVTGRLRDAIHAAGADNIDWYRLVIEDVELGKTIDDYWVGNVVGVVDCLDPERTVLDEYDLFRRMWIDEERVADFKIFRLPEHEELHILVTDDLRAAIEASGFSAVEFVPANGFTSLEATPLEEDSDVDQDEDADEDTPIQPA